MKKIEEGKEIKNVNVLETFLEANTDWLGYLKDRWQDEKKYEDWAEYKKAVSDRAIAYGLTVTKMPKGTFHIHFTDQKGRKSYIKVGARSIRTFQEKI